MLIGEFQQITEPIRDKMFRFALKMMGNTFDAEDVLQEAMIKLWRKRDRLTEIDNKEAWCMTVLRNQALDKLRAKKKKTSDITEHYDISDKGVTPDVQAELTEQVKMVKAIIDQLPEGQKTLIHLRDIEGYSYNEICDITGWKLSKVKVYLHRARMALREKLKSMM